MSLKSTRTGSWNKDDRTKSGYEIQETDGEYEIDGAEVDLRPFRYMVGGHSYVLEVSRSVICKNYRHGEASFYKCLPEELKSFTPRYLGEIYVTLHEVGDRRRFIAKIPQNIAQKCRLLEKEHDDNNEHVDHAALPNTEDSKCCMKDNEDKRYGMRTHLEEWSNRCLHRHNKAAGTWENKQTKKFLMLENLMRDFDCPSIIDIKLGKYPKVDGAEPDENCFQIDRTDQRIKFRIDGYKKFDVSTGTYTVVHKDISRNYSMKKVIEDIGNFFHDGRQVRADVINTILDRLDALRLVLSTGKEWTFNAASLLLMYDNVNNHDTVKYMEKTCIKGGNSKCDTCMKAINVEYDKFTRANGDNCDKVVNKYTLESATQLRKMDIMKLNGACIETNVSREIKAGYATVCNTTAEGSCATLNTVPGSFDHKHENVKADVKLIDFLKTTVCKHLVDENDNEVKGIAFEILKLKEILLQILCKDNM